MSKEMRRRLARLEGVKDQSGIRWVISDHPLDDDAPPPHLPATLIGYTLVSPPMTAEEWEARYCRGDR